MADIGGQELQSKDTEIESKKTSVQKRLDEAAKTLGIDEVLQFKGYYYEDSNARAKNSNGKEISFNKKFLDRPIEELDRVAWHEAQHVLWNEAGSGENPQYLWLFAFHPDFEDLHKRMESFFNRHKAEGYPFGKNFSPLPKDYDDLSKVESDSYVHPNELLALLRGYERYLRQVQENGENLEHHPYEFIGAFKPADLEFLSEEERKTLGDEVLKKNQCFL